MSDRARRWSVASVAVVVGWIGSVLAGVWIASAYSANTSANVGQHDTAIEDHEKRIRHLETCCSDTRTDIKWIRDALTRIEGKIK